MTSGNKPVRILKRRRGHFLKLPPHKKILSIKIKYQENLQNELYQLEREQGKAAKLCDFYYKRDSGTGVFLRIL